mmetsp:Transcript_31187/g.54190  ORF Transcript_31187/g.54190 Transcript_31187/m.54190 type:complete len:352 (+) Transcript_31187:109-1164(+)
MGTKQSALVSEKHLPGKQASLATPYKEVQFDHESQQLRVGATKLQKSPPPLATIPIKKQEPLSLPIRDEDELFNGKPSDIYQGYCYGYDSSSSLISRLNYKTGQTSNLKLKLPRAYSYLGRSHWTIDPRGSLYITLLEKESRLNALHMHLVRVDVAKDFAVHEFSRMKSFQIVESMDIVSACLKHNVFVILSGLSPNNLMIFAFSTLSHQWTLIEATKFPFRGDSATTCEQSNMVFVFGSVEQRFKYGIKTFPTLLTLNMDTCCLESLRIEMCCTVYYSARIACFMTQSPLVYFLVNDVLHSYHPATKEFESLKNQRRNEGLPNAKYLSFIQNLGFKKPEPDFELNENPFS